MACVERSSPDLDDNYEAPLSPASLAGVRELRADQELVEELQATIGEEEARSHLLQNDLNKFFPEDWQISQYWYDKETTRILVKELQRLIDAAPTVRVACISCPSVFRCCRPATNGTVDLFEYDLRFEAFGNSFYFYDYNSPEAVPEQCVNAYSVIILDPPFLSKDCLEKMSRTVKKLAAPEAKILLCTARELEAEAKEFMGLSRSSFVPTHRSNGITLRSEFACFCNYKFQNSGDVKEQ